MEGKVSRTRPRPALRPTQPSAIWVPGRFPGDKVVGDSFDFPPLSGAEVKETVELCLYVPSVLSWSVLFINFGYVDHKIEFLYYLFSKVV